MDDELTLQERTKGVGLALSGGGFRATLFHLGTLIRLNELGWLPKLTEITSVSGGSITAAHLGLKWTSLRFDSNGVAENFNEEVVQPLNRFCAHTIDVGSVIGGILSPFAQPAGLLEAKYRKLLFGKATLQELPKSDRGPVFTLYATNLQTGVSVRFSRSYMADYQISTADHPDIPLAKVVAASSAFPPIFCPMTIKMDPDSWSQRYAGKYFDRPSLRSKMLLADGGVYDNMGLERLQNRLTTVLVSDAGAPFSVLERSWKLRFSQIYKAARVLGIIGEQTRALRKRMLIRDYLSKDLSGAYWGIATKIGDYDLEKHELEPPIIGDSPITQKLCEMRTRLNKFNNAEQERLINWGYALTDAAMRRHVLPASTRQGTLPYPDQPME